MRRWQLSEHVWYMRDILPCSYRCHKTMKTDRACFILDRYIMLWPLIWHDDNWRSLFQSWGIYPYALTVVIRRWQLTEHAYDSFLGIFVHALSVIMRRWQLTEHVSYMNDILPFSDRCHETMTTDGTWFIYMGYITMLWPSHDISQSMVIYPSSMKHVPSVVIVSWQRSEHGNISLMSETCSISCDHLMTTDQA